MNRNKGGLHLAVKGHRIETTHPPIEGWPMLRKVDPECLRKVDPESTITIQVTWRKEEKWKK